MFRLAINIGVSLGLLAMVIGAMSLTGCASDKPGSPVYHEVKIEVPVSCVPPEYGKDATIHETPQSLLVYDGPTRYARLFADWLAKTARLEQSDRVVEGCRTAAGLKIGDVVP